MTYLTKWQRKLFEFLSNRYISLLLHPPTEEDIAREYPTETDAKEAFNRFNTNTSNGRYISAFDDYGYAPSTSDEYRKKHISKTKLRRKPIKRLNSSKRKSK